MSAFDSGPPFTAGSDRKAAKRSRKINVVEVLPLAGLVLLLLFVFGVFSRSAS